METKLTGDEPSEIQKKKRVKFCQNHDGEDSEHWKRNLQGVGDIKEFHWYPKPLRPRFKRLRAPRTIMNKKEKKQGAFQRPKGNKQKWFPKVQWQLVKKKKVFALITSTGKIFTVLIPTPWNNEVWAGLVNTKLAPFLRRCFPDRRSFTILLDGEKIFRASPPKAAYAHHGIKLLPGYPAWSPELNPAENVWPWAEDYLREHERGNSTFEAFQNDIQEAIKEYPSPGKLVGSMAKRCKDCIKRHGDHLGC